MKTKYIIWIKIISLLFYNKGTAQTWQYVGPDGFSPIQANIPVLALTSTGIPYVAYAHSSVSEKATVMKFDANSWQYVGAEDFSDSLTNYMNIAIGKNDTPYVAYTDAAYSYGIVVKKFDGSNWINVGTPGFSGPATYLAFTIDNNGILYIAFTDGSVSKKASVMKYDDSAWVYVGIQGFSTGTTAVGSIALDKSGSPYVAFLDGPIGEKGSVMKFDGSSWNNIGIAGFTDTSVSFTNIAIDTGGVPYFAYINGTQVNIRLNVMKFADTAWVHVGPSDFSPNNTAFSGLAFDKNNTPYVVFQNDTTFNETWLWSATVMKFDGNNWAYVGEEGFSHCWAFNTGIAIDTNGTPYVVYQDADLSGKIVVEKYALPTDISSVQLNPNLNIYPNPTSSKLEIDIQNAISNSLQTTVIDISGQTLIHQTINPTVKNELDISALPTGLYFIQLQDEQQMMVRKFVKE